MSLRERRGSTLGQPEPCPGSCDGRCPLATRRSMYCNPRVAGYVKHRLTHNRKRESDRVWLFCDGGKLRDFSLFDEAEARFRYRIRHESVGVT